MFRLANPSEASIVEDAIQDPDLLRASYFLSIGGEDFSDKISAEQGEWGTDDSGVNYSDLVLTTPLPARLEGAPVRFDVFLNGVRIPQLVGIDSFSATGADGASTDPFQARSAGGLANEITLDEEIEVNGWPPEQVVRKATLKLPYQRGGIKVESLAEPTLYFSLAEGTRFLPEQHPSDMYSAVQAKAPYVYKDTYDGGFVASAASALGKGSLPRRAYDASSIRGSGQNARAGWRPPPRVEPRYGRVVVFRRNPDESYAFWAEAKIDYRGYRFPPAPNRTFYVELEDPTPNGLERAQKLASELAQRFFRGIYADELIPPFFDPLLEKGDSFRVQEHYKDGEDSYERGWLGWVKTLKKDAATLLMTIGYEATIVQLEKLAIPSLIVPEISGGVAETPQAYGIDAQGLWINPKYAYNSAGVFWAGIDEDGLWIDPDLSEGLVGIDGNGLYINIPGGFDTWGDTTPTFGEMVILTFGDLA